MRNINPGRRQAAWLTALFQSVSPGIATLLRAVSPPDPLGFGAYTRARCLRHGSAFTESTAVMAVSTNGSHRPALCHVDVHNTFAAITLYFFYMCKTGVHLAAIEIANMCIIY